MGKQRKNMYWGPVEEEAIKEYIIEPSIGKRHKVYSSTIEPAFRKLIENIFYTFSFNRTLKGLENIEHELLVHLYERIGKFDINRGAKSFSFFGTICKNWLIQQSNIAKRKVTLDDADQTQYIHSISQDFYESEKKNSLDTEFIGEFTERLIEFRDNSNNLDDVAVTDIIINLLQNYPMFNIYNKKQVYLYLREGTGLPTRKITSSLKKIKLLYARKKDVFIENIETIERL
jgi:hypothetical protein